MSRTRGKREAAGSGWHTDGDPFSEERTGKKQNKRGRGKKVALIVLGCVALLAVGVTAWWSIFVKAPDVSDNDRPGVQDNNPNKNPAGDTEDGEPETASGRKEDYYTFLLLGKDTSSGSTDTIILVSYDVANGIVNCMSIPRDTMVNVPWDIKRINSVYSAKESSGGKIEGLKTQVSKLTGITPDFYVIIEWEAVGRLVDALGGVYFDVPYDMNYDDPYQDLHIHQSKGYRLLDGDDAMQVVRWRKNSNGTNYGDTVRMEVQQAFLKAVAQQCLQLGNWTKISEFAKIFAENVETDLPLNNLLWFAQKAMGVNMDNLSFVTLPGNYEGWAYSRTYGNNQSYVFAYPDQVVELVNASFNPYNREITEDDLEIMYKNKDGSLGVTNGTVLDTKAASAPVKSSGSSSSGGSTTTTTTTPDTPADTEEPQLPDTPDDAATDPSGGNTATEPGDTTGTGQPAEGGETGTVPEEPGDTEEPTLPPEPTLPGEGSEQTGGEIATDPGESTSEVDTEPPGWLTSGG